MAQTFSLGVRRVWTGMTVPGKKMMAILEPEGGLNRGKDLMALYESAGEALLMTATAIEMLPAQGLKFGPALRDLHTPFEPRTFYGAIPTDIRDFLRLRFRTTGLATTPDLAALAGSQPDPASPESAVRYSISVLDALSRRSEAVDVSHVLGRIRDLLSQTGEALASADELEAYAGLIEDLRQVRGQPIGGI